MLDSVLLFTRLKNRESSSYSWFRKYFLIFAFGMTSAAWFGHGLQEYVAPNFKVIGWICGATGLLFLQVGSLKLIDNNISTKLQSVLLKWFRLQWIIAICCMFYFLSESIESAFKVTQINSVLALWGFVLPMHIFAYYKVKIRASKIIIIALLYSAVPGFVYANQISLSQWFNYHDLSHVLMAIFMAIMFLGLYQLVKKID